jgi:hypothetical protein
MKALFLIGDLAVAHVEPIYRSSNPLHKVNASTVLILLVEENASQSALAALVRAANSPDVFTRTMAMSDIEGCGPNGANAFPIVERLTRDPNPRVSEKAKKALVAIQRK